MKRLIYVLFFVLLTSGMAYAQQAKYVFYFIGDGMGVNQVNGTEMYLAEQEGRIGVKPLLFTSFPVASMATTFSASKRRLGFFSNSLAISRRYMIFSLECSAIVTKLLFSMLAVFDYFYNTGVQR